jgi:hypothetical protein
MDAEEAEPASAAAAAAAGGPSPRGGGGGGCARNASAGGVAALSEPLPADPSKMTVAAIKQWVTGNRVEDAEFLTLCGGKAKKAEWVEYVVRRNRELGGG